MTNINKWTVTLSFLQTAIPAKATFQNSENMKCEEIV